MSNPVTAVRVLVDEERRTYTRATQYVSHNGELVLYREDAEGIREVARAAAGRWADAELVFAEKVAPAEAPPAAFTSELTLLQEARDLAERGLHLTQRRAAQACAAAADVVAEAELRVAEHQKRVTG